MPGVTVHLHLAERALAHWRRRGEAPFPLNDPDAVEAFRQGAFGPDIGYFPGGPNALSDLAHAHRTGDLCRAMVDSARTPVELAFAWGWVGHVVADTRIHPLIGCAVGEVLHGSASHFVAAESDPEAHGWVEAGLDSVFARRYPELRRCSPAPLKPGATAFIADAYERAYRIVVDRRLIERAHKAAARRAHQGLVLAGLTSHRFDTPPKPRALGARPFMKRVARSSIALAYLLPAAPPSWLLTTVRGAAREFPRTLERLWTMGLGELENRNLDNGLLDTEAADHGAAVRARMFVQQVRAGGRRPLLASIVPLPGVV